MNDNAIENARNNWEPEILDYLEELYKDHWLPSHDIEHQKRVWRNACLLSSGFNIEKEYNPKVFFEQLIIACYFHDTGLLYEKGPRHGIESRKICEQFLKLHEHKYRFDTKGLLLAIEHHDDKDYPISENSDKSVLYELLCLADDLDAFGAIGCYRYIEIYLIRNLKPAEIPVMILENAESRFLNFESKLGNSESLMQLIQKKFDIVKKLMKDGTFSENSRSLVDWIYSEVVLLQIDPNTFFNRINIDEIINGRIRFFLKQLRRELP